MAVRTCSAQRRRVRSRHQRRTRVETDARVIKSRMAGSSSSRNAWVWNDRSWREAVVRPSANAFDRYGLAYRRRGSALKYDFAANYRYVGLDVLDLILRHGHVIRRENH